MSTATGEKTPRTTPAPQPRTSGAVRDPRILAVVLVTALVGMTAALLYGGAAAPRGVADPGALVRWGLPAVETVHHVAMATVMGALLLAVGVVPHHADSSRRRGQRRGDGSTPAEHPAFTGVLQLAEAAAVVWTVSALAVLILTYSDVSGSGVGAGDNYTQQLMHYLTQISMGQAQATIVIVAAVVTTLVFGVRSLLGLLCTLGVSMVALVAMALNGHSAGGADHMGAVNSLGLHLLGVCLWVGGLLALMWVSPLLTGESTVSARRGGSGRRVPTLSVVLRRYSVVALGCYGLVALSGIVNALVRIGSWEQLDSGYGHIVLAKLALTLVLGAVGFLHRQRLIPGLENGSRSGAATVRRVVLVELAVMGLVMGVATALGRTAPPVPEEMPTDASPARLLTWYELPPEPTAWSWFTTWRIDWLWAAVVVFLATVYLWAAITLWRRGDRWSVPRTISWLVGLALLMYVTSGGAAVYARVLFSAHMVEHMSLTMLVPLFLVSGAPVTVLLRALEPRRDGTRGPREWILRLVHSTFGRIITHPVVAAANFAFSIVLFYFTDLFHFTLRHHVGHEFMIVHFLLTGYMFALVLIGVDPIPHRPTYPMRLILLLATMAAHAFIGISIMSMTAVLQASWFGNMGRPWGDSALEDQKLGGMLMWGIGEFPTFLLAVIVAVLWAMEGSKENRRVDRQADRTDDAELKAYNQMMEQLAERDQQRR